MQSAVNWEELGIEANQDRRSESRIALAIPIEVTGFDADGKFFSELSRTINISPTSCAFSLRRRVDRGGIVAIKVTSKDCKQNIELRPFLYQIARATAEGAHWIHGAAKLQPESIWSVAFHACSTNRV